MRPWTENAQVVLRKRYLLRDEKSTLTEKPSELLERVAKGVAAVEGRQARRWEAKFLEMLADLRFLPNSPTLMNAGKRRGQLSACYVLPVGDALEDIFDTLKATARIHQSGGGTGFNFSRLRPQGTRVKTTSGIASGPVSFIEIFDHTTEIIKQGGTRRGANMAILNIDHPDVRDFIASKRSQKRLNNFNISVGVHAEFMEAVIADRTYGAWSARALFREICESAWECGDPGLVFLDRIQSFNPTPAVGRLEATNPCGEQPLLPYESCNLGSLAVNRYFSAKKGFDWAAFRADIWTAVRFLDDVIDANAFPIAECGKITRANRKIGLGVMGFADLLLQMKAPYAAAETPVWAERVMSFLDREGKLASAALAKERGPFPNWKKSL
jgi:ribonucleoside-diphosphate reductase alpha chain